MSAEHQDLHFLADAAERSFAWDTNGRSEGALLVEQKAGTLGTPTFVWEGSFDETIWDTQSEITLGRATPWRKLDYPHNRLRVSAAGGSGLVVGISVWLRGDSRFINPFPVVDPMLEIPRGNVPGQSSVNKFGENPAVASGTTEDVWDGGGTYSFPTTADITHISQAVDQAAMQGETVEVEGLDINWDGVVQMVDLDGTDTTTAVALGTALLRVFRMRVLADVVTDQDINLKNVGGGTTYAVIQAGNNQTLMAIYTVPRNKKAYLTHYYGNVVPTVANDPKSTDFNLWVADRHNSYEFQLKHHKSAASVDPSVDHEFRPYFEVTQKSDIKLTAFPVNAIANVDAGFGVILVDD